MEKRARENTTFHFIVLCHYSFVSGISPTIRSFSGTSGQKMARTIIAISLSKWDNPLFAHAFCFRNSRSVALTFVHNHFIFTKFHAFICHVARLTKTNNYLLPSIFGFCVFSAHFKCFSTLELENGKRFSFVWTTTPDMDKSFSWNLLID